MTGNQAILNLRLSQVDAELPPGNAHATLYRQCAFVACMALAQEADQLAFHLATGISVECEVYAFVTHMKLGNVRPLAFESGCDLLWRPAQFKHFGNVLKEFATRQQAPGTLSFTSPFAR